MRRLHQKVGCSSYTAGSPSGVQRSRFNGRGGGEGRANCCNLVRQPSYFPKEKPWPRQAVQSVGNPQEEPRQTCAVLLDVPEQGCKQDPNCLSGFQTQAKMASFQSLESLIVTPEYQHLKCCL